MKRAAITSAFVFFVACGGEQHQEIATAATVTLPPPSAPAVASAPASASATPIASAQPTAESGPREDVLDGGANMWGDTIGDSFGAGGLGMSGDAGHGGGGIGLGNIGGLGHGSGTGQGYGTGHGRLGGGGNTTSIRQGTTTVNGSLPPEVIQRIVRQNFGRFKLCYEHGLRNNPKLAGKVAIKFVIDTTGAVSKAERDASTTMPDTAVVACVVAGFSNLSFPQPQGGSVSVVYPLVFASAASP